MANPPSYTPGFDYSGFEATSPTVPKPGAQLDNDFENIATSVNATIAALEDIRRADGKLNNSIVTVDSLDSTVLVLIGEGVAQVIVDNINAINAVGNNIASVVTVAGNMVAVVNVSNNIASVVNVSNNMAAILAALSGALVPANNLSDIANVATARSNLGLADQGTLASGTALRRRRGTTAQHATFTGLQGEITFDTSKNTLVAHDGATAGGLPLARAGANTDITSIANVANRAAGDNSTFAANTAYVDAAARGPVFSAYSTSAQAIPTQVFTKVALQTTQFDTASAFNTSTYRFQPTKAGYYDIMAGVACQVSPATQIVVSIYKNGSPVRSGANGPSMNSGSAAALVSLNGTTDYVELFVYFGSGQNALQGASGTFLEGNFVRAL